MRKLQLLVFFIFYAIALVSCIASTDMYDNCDCDCQVQNFTCPGALKKAKERIAILAFQYAYDLLQSSCVVRVAAIELVFYILVFLGLKTDINTPAFEELSNFSQLYSKDEMNCTLQNFNTYDYNKPDAVKFFFSDNILSDERNPFPLTFKQQTNTTFDGNAMNYNSCDPVEAQSNVNDVIYKETNNSLQNAIPCSSVFTRNCTASKIVVACGRYFETTWARPFAPAGKQNYTDQNNNTYQVDFVQQCGTYNYTDCDDIHAQVISIFLRKGYFQYVMFIPHSGYTALQMATELQKPGKFNKAMNDLRPTKIKFSLPKYAGGICTTNFLAPLKKRGIVSSYFNSETSSFTGVNDKQRKSYIDSGISSVLINNVVSLNKSATKECTKSMKKVTVNSPAIYAFIRCGVIKLVGIGNVNTN